MKKIIPFALLLLLGLVAFVTFFPKNAHTAKVSNSEFHLFGQVDVSDEEDERVDSADEEGSDNDDAFANFVKTHKTPFSKTINR